MTEAMLTILPRCARSGLLIPGVQVGCCFCMALICSCIQIIVPFVLISRTLSYSSCGYWAVDTRAVVVIPAAFAAAFPVSVWASDRLEGRTVIYASKGFHRFRNHAMYRCHIGDICFQCQGLHRISLGLYQGNSFVHTLDFDIGQCNSSASCLGIGKAQLAPDPRSYIWLTSV